MGIRFAPIIDGYFLSDSPLNTLERGQQNDTPFMTGLNSGETRYNGEKSEALFAFYPLGPNGDTAGAEKIAAQEQSRLNTFLYLEQRAKTSNTNGYIYYLSLKI